MIKPAIPFVLVALLGGAASAQPAREPANAVRDGVEAYRAQNYDEAVRLWRPLADRGDADAQYNLAQAYFLGRGVPQNAALAEQWYARAARQGHPEATANYGLLLFQNGRRQEALPFLERAAEAGDPRAQYVYGTTLFNGDLAARDLPRAYAFMSRAAQQNLPPAVTQLAEMERHLSPQDRSRGTELARAMRMAPPPERLAAAEPPPPRRPVQSRPRPVTPQRPELGSPTAAARPAARPAPARPAPVQTAAGGRWRIQLGAFASDANARRAWGAVAGRLAGAQPYYVRVGNVIRVQAGPFRDRAAAARACGIAGGGCFPVAP